jgi:hypothetical protein|tara:strand:- start:1732 stop:3762 length:2031 start_codon:yes stop_codon:yes gene_type:complete
MSTQTILYIIGSGILALFIALFQYIYKTKQNRLHWSLAGVRFISIFSLLLLIINPKFETKESEIVKPVLAVIVDNSQSVKYLNKDSIASKSVQTILGNTEITSKYEVKVYPFGTQINQNPELTFEDAQTNITKSLQDIESLYHSQLAPVVLISDGNQTIGDDYEFASKQFEQIVFPLILGDSIYHTDLKIQQINVNKYTYLNNKFPVEIIASYTGNTAVQSELRIESGGRIIHKERVRLSATNNSIILTPKITSTKVGVQRYQVSLTPIENEKNTINNQKSFAIETLDEYTNIALVTSLSHPDLGALKAAIETNKQRLVKICSPTEYLATNETYGLAILYQPNQSFKAVFDLIEKRKLNTFIIGGTQTQWAFLNSIQTDFKQEITGQRENYQGFVNPNFNNFSVDNFTFNAYPPLTAEFGSISINVPHETLLFKSINGLPTQDPLWFTYENNAQRSAVLLAENLWKWRMHSFREDQNFKTFDSFMAKLIQYLNIKNQNTRLLVNYESIYDGSQPLEISAQFFNKNYEPNRNAEVLISLINKDTKQQLEYPMIAVQNSYTVNLNTLEPGNYSFEVNAENGAHRSFGAIEILDFNIEQQFINANVQKLEQLAIHTEGTAFFDTQTDELMSKLISDNRFSSIQKITKKTVPLIGIKFWLLLLLLSLAIEWFIRKYNGLI